MVIRTVFHAVLLALLLAACGAPERADAPTPGATAAPTVAIAPTPGGETPTQYTDPAGWVVEYPGQLLGAPTHEGALVRFAGHDPAVVVLIEALDAGENITGNTGEGLRNRAADLAVRLASPDIETNIIDPPTAPWAGVRFRSQDGAVGAAFYAQPGSASADYRVYGFGYRLPASGAAQAAPQLERMRASFQFPSGPGAEILFLGANGVTVSRVSPDGGQARPVYTITAEAGATVSSLSASPDGQHLVYGETSAEGSTTYWHALVTAGDVEPLGALAAPPAWSPDGARLVYHPLNEDGSLAPARLLDVAGGAPPQELPFGGRAAWYPDGQRLLYIAFDADGDAGGTSNLYRFDPASQQSAPLTRFGQERGSSWTILAALATADDAVLFYGGRSADLGASGNGMFWWRLEPGSFEPSQLSAGLGGNHVVGPALSAEGGLLAYGEHAHGGACATLSAVALLPPARAQPDAPNTPQELLLPALVLSSHSDVYGLIAGLSWDTPGARLVYAVAPYRCPDGEELEPQIYLWRRDNGAVRPLGAGSFPSWVR